MRNNTTRRLAETMQMDENEVACLLKALLDEASDETIEWFAGIILRMSMDNQSGFTDAKTKHRNASRINETLNIATIMNGWTNGDH